MRIMLTSNLALPQKPTDTRRLHRDAPTQEYPFKTEIVIASPNVTVKEKVKQNEKTKAFVAN